jgi:hypothetical protein
MGVLETEGGQKQRTTMKRGFVSYVAKKNVGATNWDMKEKNFGGPDFVQEV